MENGIKILVVEDVEIAQKMAKITLVGLGCSVDVAEAGQKVLEMFKENEYDLIFMDIGLPDISGVEVTKEIRKIEDKKSHVPIVALTANCDESYKTICLEAGIDDFMLKPLTKDNALTMLDKFSKRAK